MTLLNGVLNDSTFIHNNDTLTRNSKYALEIAAFATSTSETHAPHIFEYYGTLQEVVFSPRLVCWCGILVQSEGLHIHCPALHPKLVLPHQGRQHSLQEGSVSSCVVVEVYHLRQQRRLASSGVVHTTAIGHQTIPVGWSEDRVEWSEDRVGWSEDRVGWSEDRVEWSEDQVEWSE